MRGIEQRPQPGEAKARPREEHRHQGHRADREDRARHREVVLRHALLDEVADHDQQDHVERLERRELAPSHDPRHEPDEGEEDDCAEDDVHQGHTVTVRSR